MKAKLTLAIQKSGKLYQGSIDLIRNLGIEFCDQSSQLVVTATNFPLEIFLLRDDDIPRCVESGIADMGIIGENIFLEKEKIVKVVNRLGFGKCRLSIAVPKNESFSTIEDLVGKKIATSHYNILYQYLKEKNVNADVYRMAGSVEAATSMGISDAVCDLVSSGKTLVANNLKEIQVIMKSEALLISSTFLSKEKIFLLEKLLSLFNSQKCRGTISGEHQWVYPRIEDSIDKCRLIPEVYCGCCFIKQK